MSFCRGHPFLNFTLYELAINFNASVWGNQGPMRVSASAKKYCDFESGLKMLEGNICIPKDNNTGKGDGFTILHHSTGILMHLLWHLS